MWKTRSHVGDHRSLELRASPGLRKGPVRTKLLSGSSLHSVGVRDNSMTRGLGV